MGTRKPISTKEYYKFDEAGAVKISKPGLLTKIDEPTSTATYVGDAVHSTNIASVGWRIKKIVVDGNVTTISYADGVETFVKIWDDRTTYSY